LSAIRCIQGEPGEIHHVRNGIAFQRNNTVLTMILPSGRRLVYWYPRLEMKPMPWDPDDLRPAVTFYAEDSQKKIWCRHTAYGGLWCENAVQATARDIMAYALVNLEKLGAQPVLTVHDEAVCQVSKAKYPDRKDAAGAVKQVMLLHPDYLPDFFPLQADASADERYVKA
jgi:DNA polymerase